jgi:hypothetical protein
MPQLQKPQNPIEQNNSDISIEFTRNNKPLISIENQTFVVMAKPNKMVAIRADKSDEFIREFNNNVVSKEFLESCEKFAESFCDVDSDS